MFVPNSRLTWRPPRSLVVDTLTGNCALHALRAAPATMLATAAALSLQGVRRDCVTVNTLLRGASMKDAGSRGERAAAAHALLREAAEAGISPDSGTLAAAVAALGCAGRCDDAMVVWTDMRAGGVVPCERGWTALLVALREARNLERATSVFAALPVRPTSHHWNVLIDTAVRAGQHGRALALADEMDARGTPRDGVTRNTLLRAVAAMEGAEAALRFAEAAPSAPRATELLMWTQLLEICASRADVRTAARAVVAMRSRGCEPDVVALCSLAKAHGATRDADGALALLRHAAPSRALFLAVLRACRAADDVGAASAAFAAMRRSGVRPSGPAFRALLSEWAADGGARGTLPDWLVEGASADTFTSAGASAVVVLDSLTPADARATLLCALRRVRDDRARRPVLPLQVRCGADAAVRAAAARLFKQLELPCVANHEAGELLVTAPVLGAWLGRVLREGVAVR